MLQVVEASDVIIEVLDARDPLGCRCLDVERFVRKLDPSKKIVLLLNKIGAGRQTNRCWIWLAAALYRGIMRLHWPVVVPADALAFVLVEQMLCCHCLTKFYTLFLYTCRSGAA